MPLPMPRLALLPGTFDPITLGHLDLLRRALRLFERVEVAVGVNPAKRTLLPDAERVALVEACVAGWPEAGRVSVAAFEGLLAEHARRRGASAVVRGLRQVADFDYEMRMAVANRRLAPEVETVFLAPAAEHAFTSSSLVREIHRFGGDVSPFVPPPVLERLSRMTNDSRDE